MSPWIWISLIIFVEERPQREEEDIEGVRAARTATDGVLPPGEGRTGWEGEQRRQGLIHASEQGVGGGIQENTGKLMVDDGLS